MTKPTINYREKVLYGPDQIATDLFREIVGIKRNRGNNSLGARNNESILPQANNTSIHFQTIQKHIPDSYQAKFADFDRIAQGLHKEFLKDLKNYLSASKIINHPQTGRREIQQNIAIRDRLGERIAKYIKQTAQLENDIFSQFAKMKHDQLEQIIANEDLYQYFSEQISTILKLNNFASFSLKNPVGSLAEEELDKLPIKQDHADRIKDFGLVVPQEIRHNGEFYSLHKIIAAVGGRRDAEIAKNDVASAKTSVFLFRSDKGKEVVVKIIKFQNIDDSSISNTIRYSASQMREIGMYNLLNKTQSPLILKQLQYGFIDDKEGGAAESRYGGFGYIVTEKCDIDLRQAIDESFTTGQNKGWLDRSYYQSIAKSLKLLHDTGIMHRDIKPENFLIQNDPETGKSQIKLSDLETAIIAPEPIPGKEHEVEAGDETPFYYHENDGGKFYKSSDVHALGVTFYEMATGTKPGESLGKKNNEYNTNINQRQDLINLKQNIGIAVKESRITKVEGLTILKMMHFNKDKRPDISQVVAIFTQILENDMENVQLFYLNTNRHDQHLIEEALQRLIKQEESLVEAADKTLVIGKESEQKDAPDHENGPTSTRAKLESLKKLQSSLNPNLGANMSGELNTKKTEVATRVLNEDLPNQHTGIGIVTKKPEYKDGHWVFEIDQISPGGQAEELGIRKGFKIIILSSDNNEQGLRDAANHVRNYGLSTNDQFSSVELSDGNGNNISLTKDHAKTSIFKKQGESYITEDFNSRELLETLSLQKSVKTKKVANSKTPSPKPAPDANASKILSARSGEAQVFRA